jgi:hypothetical protein
MNALNIDQINLTPNRQINENTHFASFVLQIRGPLLLEDDGAVGGPVLLLHLEELRAEHTHTYLRGQRR